MHTRYQYSGFISHTSGASRAAESENANKFRNFCSFVQSYRCPDVKSTSCDTLRVVNGLSLVMADLAFTLASTSGFRVFILGIRNVLMRSLESTQGYATTQITLPGTMYCRVTSMYDSCYCTCNQLYHEANGRYFPHNLPVSLTQ